MRQRNKGGKRFNTEDTEFTERKENEKSEFKRRDTEGAERRRGLTGLRATTKSETTGKEKGKNETKRRDTEDAERESIGREKD